MLYLFKTFQMGKKQCVKYFWQQIIFRDCSSPSSTTVGYIQRNVIAGFFTGISIYASSHMVNGGKKICVLSELFQSKLWICH